MNDAHTAHDQERWLDAFRNGESKVLGSLYFTHVDQVRRWLRLRLGNSGRLSSVALEDLVQETFVKAFSPRARASYDASRAYAPYLLAIARNCLIDWLRHARRLQTLECELDQVVDTADAGPRTPCFPADLVVTTNRLLSGMPLELDRVYFRRYELDESQQRAAEVLGISRQNLRTLERKLLSWLRRELLRVGLNPRQPNTGHRLHLPARASARASGSQSATRSSRV